MADKLIENETPSLSACTEALEIELSAEERAALQAEADHRGVSLEEYARWRARTAGAVANAGGSSMARSGAA